MMSKMSKFVTTYESGDITVKTEVIVSKEIDQDLQKKIQKVLELDTIFFLTECVRPVMDGKVDLSEISTDGG